MNKCSQILINLTILLWAKAYESMEDVNLKVGNNYEYHRELDDRTSPLTKLIHRREITSVNSWPAEAPQISLTQVEHYLSVKCIIRNHDPHRSVFVSCPALTSNTNGTPDPLTTGQDISSMGLIGGRETSSQCYENCKPIRPCSSYDRLLKNGHLHACVPHGFSVNCTEESLGNAGRITKLLIDKRDARLVGYWSCIYGGKESNTAEVTHFKASSSQNDRIGEKGKYAIKISNSNLPTGEPKVDGTNKRSNIHLNQESLVENISAASVYKSESNSSIILLFEGSFSKPTVIFFLVGLLAISLCLNLIFCIRCLVITFVTDLHTQNSDNKKCFKCLLCLPNNHQSFKHPKISTTNGLLKENLSAYSDFRNNLPRCYSLQGIQENKHSAEFSTIPRGLNTKLSGHAEDNQVLYKKSAKYVPRINLQQARNDNSILLLSDSILDQNDNGTRDYHTPAESFPMLAMVTNRIKPKSSLKSHINLSDDYGQTPRYGFDSTNFNTPTVYDDVASSSTFAAVTSAQDSKYFSPSSHFHSDLQRNDVYISSYPIPSSYLINTSSVNTQVQPSYNSKQLRRPLTQEHYIALHPEENLYPVNYKMLEHINENSVSNSPVLIPSNELVNPTVGRVNNINSGQIINANMTYKSSKEFSRSYGNVQTLDEYNKNFYPN